MSRGEPILCDRICWKLVRFHVLAEPVSIRIADHLRSRKRVPKASDLLETSDPVPALAIDLGY